MKRSVSLLALVLLVIGSFAAQEQDLIINARTIEYSQDMKQLIASGSVEAYYKDFKLTSEQLTYDTEKRFISAGGGFDFDLDGITIEGRSLDYWMIERRGSAEGVAVGFRHIDVYGQYLKFDRERLDLTNASFTTCDLAHPHYHITASSITLYPKIGWLVAYWGLLWAGNLPVIPVPAYVYDVEAERKGRKNVLPYPVMGSNADEGFFLSESLPWTIKRELNGSVTVTYAEKKGVGGGAEANYILNRFNDGNVRLYGNPVDQFWGGVTHNYSFGAELGQSAIDLLGAKSILDLVGSYRRFNLQTLLSYREKVNYEKVTRLPEFTFSASEMYLGKLRMDSSLTAGLVTEESSGVSMARGDAQLNLSYPIHMRGEGVVTLGWDMQGTIYDKVNPWLKSIAKVRWNSPTVGRIAVYAGYSHYAYLWGTSPFNYELYRFNRSDTISGGLYSILGSSRLGVEAVYNIPDMTPYDVDVLLKIGIHCYNINIIWRAVRNEFNLGVDLN